MAEPAVITLEDPITTPDGEVITTITLRPPTLKDRHFLDTLGLSSTKEGKADIGPWASTAYGAVRLLGGLSDEAAEQLTAGDAMQVYTEVMLFIGGSQAIGQTA